MTKQPEPSAPAMAAARAIFERWPAEYKLTPESEQRRVTSMAAMIDACFATATSPATVSALQDAIRQQLQVIISESGNLKTVTRAYFKNDAQESADAIERAVKQIDTALSGVMAEPAGATALAQDLSALIVKLRERLADEQRHNRLMRARVLLDVIYQLEALLSPAGSRYELESAAPRHAVEPTPAPQEEQRQLGTCRNTDPAHPLEATRTDWQSLEVAGQVLHTQTAMCKGWVPSPPAPVEETGNGERRD